MCSMILYLGSAPFNNWVWQGFVIFYFLFLFHKCLPLLSMNKYGGWRSTLRSSSSSHIQQFASFVAGMVEIRPVYKKGIKFSKIYIVFWFIEDRTTWSFMIYK